MPTPRFTGPRSKGRGTYRFFEAAMGAEVKERRHIEHDLLHAVSRGELRLAYQPQKLLTSGEVIGFEALLRWQHATRGAISPDTFIPIAEESGLILQIGEWVLRTACREAATWKRPLVVAVNVSAVQLHSAQFAHAVHEILFQTGLARKSPGTRNHRNGAGARQESRLGDAAPAQGARRADRHGRFRHRLFVALQPARLSVRQDQDRRLVHPLGRQQRRGRPRSCAPYSGLAAGSACRCWPKASRRPANSLFCGRILPGRPRLFSRPARADRELWSADRRFRPPGERTGATLRIGGTPRDALCSRQPCIDRRNLPVLLGAERRAGGFRKERPPREARSASASRVSALDRLEHAPFFSRGGRLAPKDQTSCRGFSRGNRQGWKRKAKNSNGSIRTCVSCPAGSVAAAGR